MTASIDKLSEEDINFLIQTYKHVNGTIDFDKVAEEMDVANGDAAGKRMRRYFQKAGIVVKMVGNRIGNDAQSGSRAVAPRKASIGTATRGAGVLSSATKTNKRKQITAVSKKKVDKAAAKEEIDTEEEESSDEDVEQGPAAKKAKHEAADDEEGTDDE